MYGVERAVCERTGDHSESSLFVKLFFGFSASSPWTGDEGEAWWS
jgi:hypothetical protein